MNRRKLRAKEIFRHGDIFSGGAFVYSYMVGMRVGDYAGSFYRPIRKRKPKVLARGWWAVVLDGKVRRVYDSRVDAIHSLRCAETIERANIVGAK